MNEAPLQIGVLLIFPLVLRYNIICCAFIRKHARKIVLKVFSRSYVVIVKISLNACYRPFKLDIVPKNLYIFHTSGFGGFTENRPERNILNHYVPKRL